MSWEEDGETLGAGRMQGEGGHRPHRWPAPLSGHGSAIWYGGDYYPEQWPRSVWDEDVDLMVEAGVNIVSLGIFAWARLEPSDGVWDFAWLDDVIGRLGRAGIAVDLASATATAPLWLYEQHPEVLPRERDGTVVNAGTRQSWRPASPVFRRYALRLCRTLALHYRDNPYVVAWHVGNEYGWNNAADYSDDAEEAFRVWCRKRYGSIERVNGAWGTDFWSQRLQDFAQILIPRHAGGDDAMTNPGLELDFRRFCSDCLLDFFKAERDELAAVTPDRPLTTNFMVSTDQCPLDYESWSRQVDFVSNDHYFHSGPGHLDELACSDALVSALACRQPWYLMEHSTSAVNWRSYNPPKRSGELVRDALAHVALGADGVDFFQWRQSRTGAEAFHSAMVPHAGAKTDIFRQVRELGRLLRVLSAEGVMGSRVDRAQVAILFDAGAEWACGCRTLPDRGVDHWNQVLLWFRALLDCGVRADVVPVKGDWSSYAAVVLPGLLTVSDAQSERLHRFVDGGGHLVVDFASGIMDEEMHVGLGGYPAALRDLTGVSGQEIVALGRQETGGGPLQLTCGGLGGTWAVQADIRGDGVAVLARYKGTRARSLGLDGLPAITLRGCGSGSVAYFGCGLELDDLARVIGRLLPPGFFHADLQEGGTCDPRLLQVTRRGADGGFLFAFNRGDAVIAEVPLPGEAVVLYRSRALLYDSQDASKAYAMKVNGLVVTRL